MQHLLLAISIITLTLLAGNKRGKTAPENNRVSLEMERPAVKHADMKVAEDKPPVLFSRFEMFVY